MSDHTLHTAGLSGDLGWNEVEVEERPLGGLDIGLLVLVTGAVWGAVWLLSGLPPLLSVAHALRSKQA
jgi:hypothetical protein